MKMKNTQNYNFYADVISNIEGEGVDIETIIEYTFKKCSDSSLLLDDYLKGIEKVRGNVKKDI